MNVRPATRKDFEAFFGKPAHRTFKGLVAEDGEGLKGIGGYYLENGIAVVFTDSRPMAGRDVVRCGKEIMAFLERCPAPVVAQEGEHGTTALKHFGFTPYRNGWWRYDGH